MKNQATCHVSVLYGIHLDVMSGEKAKKNTRMPFFELLGMGKLQSRE